MQLTGLNRIPMDVTKKNRGMVQATTSESVIDQMLAGWAFEICEDTVTPTGVNDFMAFQNISNELAVLTLLALTDASAEIITGSIARNYEIGGTNAVPDTAFNRSGAFNALSEKMRVAIGVVVSGTGTILSVPLGFLTGAGTQHQNILADRTPIVIPPLHTLTLGVATGTAAITLVRAELHFIAEPFVGGP